MCNDIEILANLIDTNNNSNDSTGNSESIVFQGEETIFVNALQDRE